MHHLRGSTHLPAVGFAETLVAEANAERREGRAQLEEEILTDTCIGRCPGPGREHSRNGVQIRNLLERDLVVAVDNNLLAQLTQVLNEVVGEGIVVVDHQHDVAGIHVSPPRRAPAAARTLYCGSRGIFPRGPSRNSYRWRREQ